MRSPPPTPARAGDVIFRLKQSPHARFRREGDDLHHELHISLREALLGYTKAVRHLDGRDVIVEHKGVTQPFQVRRVSEQPDAASSGSASGGRSAPALPAPCPTLHSHRWIPLPC